MKFGKAKTVTTDAQAPTATGNFARTILDIHTKVTSITSAVMHILEWTRHQAEPIDYDKLANALLLTIAIPVSQRLADLEANRAALTPAEYEETRKRILESW